MKPPISLQRIQQVVRARVCAACKELPPGARGLPLDQPLSCEAGCELFRALPNLRTLAVHRDPIVGDFGRAAAAAFGPVVATPNGRKAIAALRELTGC